MPVPQFDNPSAGLYWGAVEGAARQGLNTAQVWDAIRAQADLLGLSSPGITAQDVSRLRGEAGGVIRAEQALAKAPADYSIGANMIAEPWFGRTPAQKDTMPIYQVRFQHTVNVNGEEQTLWRTVTFRGGLAPTVGDLQAAVEQDAAEMAEGYGQTHVGVGALQLLAV